MPATYWLNEEWLKRVTELVFAVVREEKVSVRFLWLVYKHSSCLQMPAPSDLDSCVFSFLLSLCFAVRIVFSKNSCIGQPCQYLTFLPRVGERYVRLC